MGRIQIKSFRKFETEAITFDSITFLIIANNVAKKATKILAELMPNNVAVPVEHLVGRQKWVIYEALRLEEIPKLNNRIIHNLLWGVAEKGIQPHP